VSMQLPQNTGSRSRTAPHFVCGVKNPAKYEYQALMMCSYSYSPVRRVSHVTLVFGSAGVCSACVSRVEYEERIEKCCRSRQDL